MAASKSQSSSSSQSRSSTSSSSSSSSGVSGLTEGSITCVRAAGVGRGGGARSPEHSCSILGVDASSSRVAGVGRGGEALSPTRSGSILLGPRTWLETWESLAEGASRWCVSASRQPWKDRSGSGERGSMVGLVVSAARGVGGVAAAASGLVAGVGGSRRASRGALMVDRFVGSLFYPIKTFA